MAQTFTTFNLKTIGDNLRWLRKDRGYTQKMIARHLGVSFQQVQKYETGQNKIPIEKLYQLKHMYQISYDVFFRMGEKAENEYDLFDNIPDINEEEARQKLIQIINVIRASV